MDLRDEFAIHFAAALTRALVDPERIARRAYDLAEALLLERARRVDADETAAIAGERPLSRRFTALESSPMAGASEVYDGLLDPPAEMIEEDDVPPGLAAEGEPSGEIEPRWAREGERAAASERPRPGLARTQPEPARTSDRPATKTG